MAGTGQEPRLELRSLNKEKLKRYVEAPSPVNPKAKRTVAPSADNAFLAVGLYVLCSSCMLIVNKAAINALPFSYTVTAMQTGASAILLLGARWLEFVEFSNPSLSLVWSWSGVLFAWVCPIMLNMNAVRLVSVETLMMFRSATVIAVAFADRLLLGTKIGVRGICACLIISAGGVMYAWHDINFHSEGYMWGSMYALSMVFNSIYVKYTFNKYKCMNVWEKTYLNNLLSTPIVLLVAWRYEDYSDVLNGIRALDKSGWVAVLLSCVMGLGISMSGNSCRTVLSATSFDVLGTCTKYLTLGLSVLILKSANTFAATAGIVIALSGCALYSQAGGKLVETIFPKNQKLE